ncbi:MAG TPA: M12 family metallopeptidase [Anaerolineae bacterium]|nr:M12 family metallopeptidase [Anaerolineae bacterium]
MSNDVFATGQEVKPEVRTGYIAGETFDAKLVRYSVVGDLAIFEGDIILGTVEEVERFTKLVDEKDIARFDPTAESGEIKPEGVVIPGSRFRWRDGVVPFQIDPNLPAAQATAANNAVTHWRNNTRLNLVQRNAANAAQFPDFIEFVRGDGCSSPVGRQGGRQTLNLAAGCGTTQAIHEMGHAVGLWHEQSREDRDSFVTINWQNIQDGREHNFNQHISDGDDVGPYDYASLMHYDRCAFSDDCPAGQSCNCTRETITPTQAGAVIGTGTGLSAGDRHAVRYMYSNIEPALTNTYVGNFSGGGKVELLYYLRSRMTWYHGTWNSGNLLWSQVGDTSGFGQIGDGCPFWVGDFNADGKAEVLFYYPGDGNWWLGRLVSGQLQWSLICNTRGQIAGDPNFGQVWDGRPFWVGSFSQTGRSEILFYYPGDDNWWLGSWNGARLAWSLAGNTAGFGHGINDGRPFWIGDFNGDGRDDVLFYFPGDGNWWLGAHNGGTLQWSFVSNTSGAQRPPPPFPAQCQGLLNELNDLQAQIAALQAELSTAGPTEKPAIVRQIRALQSQANTVQQNLNTCIAQNTPPQPPPWPNFGQIWDGRPFWIGRFSRADRAEVLFYNPGDGNWQLGSYNGSELRWSFAGNTEGFGHGINDGRPFWIGDFNGDGRDDVLFYFPGDGNWWLGVHNGSQLQWSCVSNTEGFGHGINDGRPFWIGRFSRADKAQVLFYFSGDGFCWLATHNGSQLAWTYEATFEF